MLVGERGQAGRVQLLLHQEEQLAQGRVVSRQGSSCCHGLHSGWFYLGQGGLVEGQGGLVVARERVDGQRRVVSHHTRVEGKSVVGSVQNAACVLRSFGKGLGNGREEVVGGGAVFVGGAQGLVEERGEVVSSERSTVFLLQLLLV